MKRLAISLLGSFQAALNGRPVAFEADTARALLARLACDPTTAHSREAVAGLLWPDRSAAMALQNLRQALNRLRHAIQDETSALPCLLITRRTIQFNPAADYWLDVAEFEERMAAVKHHRHRRREACRLCMEQLRAAVDLYRGDFLTGLSVDSADFEAWLRIQQEQFHGQALWILDQMVAYHARRREVGQVQQYARRQLALEPWHEAAHARLMWALALNGQRDAALNQFHACRRVLEDELGIGPSEDTLALYEGIRSGQTGGGQADRCTLSVSPSLHNLPAGLTPFIGRQSELAEVAGILNDPDCRLLTLVGLGGTGKTRLALEAAHAHKELFRDGVYFVPLAGLYPSDSDSDALPERLATAIVTALQRAMLGSPALKGNPQTTLLSFLREKEMLIVLDDFEHLVESAQILLDILQAAREVALLVTSRERLNLRGEWVLQVRGLDYPALDSQAGAAHYDAVQFFIHSARAAWPGFEPSPANLSAVVRICHLVQGLPLGIQLAAAWVSTLSVEQIASRIEHDMYFLRALHRDVPERHRSLQAVFEHSWRLLSEPAQSVFMQLSVFRGGFTLEAAEVVAGATPDVLAALAGKSFLQRRSPERHELHPLLQHYAAEKLAASPVRRTSGLERHSRYYLTFLERHRTALAGAAVAGARAAIEGEIENVRAAWHWAVTHAGLAEVDRGLESLSRFYYLSGLSQEGATIFGLAVESARRLAEAGELERDRQITLGKLLTERARFLNELSAYEEAIVLAQAAMDLARIHDAAGLEIAGRLQWGQALWRKGNYPDAQAQLEPALALAQAMCLQQATTDSLRNLGIVSFYRGDYARARIYFEQSLLVCREIGDRWGEGAALGNLGLVAQYQADHARARVCFEQSLRLHREIGDPRREGIALSNLGNVLRIEGDYLGAKSYCEKTLGLCRAIGDRWTEGIALGSLSEILLDLGDYAGARAAVEQGLLVYREIGDRYDEGQALITLATILDRLGEAKTAYNSVQQALLIAREMGDRKIQGDALTLLGHVLARQARLAEAAEAYQQALALVQAQEPPNLAAVAGLADIARAQGDLVLAQDRVEAILSHLESGTARVPRVPFQVYLTCYEILQASQHPGAGIVLDHAHDLLQGRAARIDDENYRRSFLENVPPHREIMSRAGKNLR